MEVSEAAFRLPFSVFRRLDTVCLWTQPSEDRVQEEHPFPRAGQAPRRSWLHLAEDFLPRQPPIRKARFRETRAFENDSGETRSLDGESIRKRPMRVRGGVLLTGYHLEPISIRKPTYCSKLTVSLARTSTLAFKRSAVARVRATQRVGISDS
jgi:hypothetical protein